MVETKIVFLDVDGTITDYENRIPASAKRAIRAAREKGNRVYMCTGRSKAENPPELTEIGFDGMIGGNGAYIEDAGEVVMHQLITLDQCRHIVSWLEGRGLEFNLETNNGLFASRNFREAARPVLRLYAGRKGMAGADELETDDAMHGLVYGGELVRDDVNKVPSSSRATRTIWILLRSSLTSRQAPGEGRARQRSLATSASRTSRRPMRCRCSSTISVHPKTMPLPSAMRRSISRCSSSPAQASAWEMADLKRRQQPTS